MRGVMYVARTHVRFGDGWLAPGDPVPVEPGRSYELMLRTGQIQRAVDDQPVVEPVRGTEVATVPADEPKVEPDPVPGQRKPAASQEETAKPKQTRKRKPAA